MGGGHSMAIKVEVWDATRALNPESAAAPSLLDLGREVVNREIAVVVWHNASPTAEDLQRMGQKRPSARILLVTGGGPTAASVEQLRAHLNAEQRKRVFGCTVADSLNALGTNQQLYTKVVEFLGSQDELPNDSEVARYLGLDFPVRRLALRVALEIAREELNRNRPELGVNDLLKPALDIAQNVPPLERALEPVRTALAQNVELCEFQKAIQDSLGRLVEKEETERQ